jgi:uncharacterized surface anchored protein
MQIIKVDAATNEPLKGAEFKVCMASGELLTTAVTDGCGLAILDGLDPGWLKVLETPQGTRSMTLPRTCKSRTDNS